MGLNPQVDSPENNKDILITETEKLNLEINGKTKKPINKDLPNFSKGEEIFNAVTHIVGASFGIIALVVGVVIAALYSNAWGITSMVIYGVSMILLYVMSSIYHFLRKNKAKKVFRIFDHCTIYLLIAGTYTPFCLVALRNSGAWGYTIFGIVWGFAILGIIANAINMYSKPIIIFSQISYLAMGWCCIVAIVPLLKVLSVPGFILLLLGGVMYTIGAVFYLFGHKAKYIHSVWHLFVLAGSTLHFFSILFYVIL